MRRPDCISIIPFFYHILYSIGFYILVSHTPSLHLWSLCLCLKVAFHIASRRAHIMSSQDFTVRGYTHFLNLLFNSYQQMPNPDISSEPPVFQFGTRTHTKLLWMCYVTILVVPYIPMSEMAKYKKNDCHLNIDTVRLWW